MKIYGNFPGVFWLVGLILSQGTVKAAVEINPNPDKLPKVVQIQYHKNWTYSSVELDASPIANDETEYIKWDEKKHGYWKNDSCFGNVHGDDYYFFWNERIWDDSGLGVSWGLVTRGRKSEVCGVKDYHSDEQPYTAPTDWPGEHSSGKQSRIIQVDTLQPCEPTKQTVTRKTHTRYELRTGGKKAGGKKNLFVLTASAENHANLFHPEIEDNPVSTPIAYTSIALGDLGKLGGDGRLYKALGDGETRNVTPTVEGSRYYRFGQPVPKKYKAYFWAYVRMADPLGGPSDVFDFGNNAGHAWWKLATAAPLSDLIGAGVNETTAGFANVQSGFFPVSTLGALDPTGTDGYLNITNNGSPHVWRRFRVDFDKFISGLNYTRNLYDTPGTYRLFAPPSQCVTKTREAASESGVQLPAVITPQNMGIELRKYPADNE